MKTYIIALLLSGSVIGFSSCAVEGGVVDTRPADVIYVRPASPGAGYVWIDGDWRWRGNAYRWREGRWRRTTRSWDGGRWEPVGSGWRWRRGHWR